MAVVIRGASLKKFSSRMPDENLGLIAWASIKSPLNAVVTELLVALIVTVLSVELISTFNKIWASALIASRAMKNPKRANCFIVG